MSLLAHKLMACILVMALAIASSVCGCTDSDHPASGITSDAPSGDDHDGAHPSDQNHHDSCQCITNFIYVTDQPVLSHLDSTILSPFFNVPLVPVLSPGLLLSTNSLMIASGRPPSLQTTLLRLHCALVV